METLLTNILMLIRLTFLKLLLTSHHVLILKFDMNIVYTTHFVSVLRDSYDEVGF